MEDPAPQRVDAPPPRAPRPRGEFGADGLPTSSYIASFARKFPYPFVPPAQVPSWADYSVWEAARFRARDNYSRMWRRFGATLPAKCPEWDPPIPEPLNDGPRPANLPRGRRVQIPEEWLFEANALTRERQE